MKRKIISGILITSFILTAVTGCGKKTAEGTTEVTEEEQSTTSGGQVNLVLWGAADDQEILSAMAESFKTQYSSEASINIEVGILGEVDSKDTVLSDVEGSADVFSFADDQVRTFVAAGALSPVVNADTVKSENMASAVEAASVNGTLFAYPTTADNGYFMYYNKAYFSDSDVTSLDRMLEVAKENNKKITMDLTSACYFYSFFGQSGMELGLNDDGVTNYCNWNATDTAVKGVDVAESLIDIAAHEGFLCGNDEVLVEGAQKDTVIAGISGVWLSGNLSKAWGNNLGAVKLPAYTCAGKQVQMGSFCGYKMVGVNAYSDNVEWAHKLAQWISNEQNQTIRFQMRGQGPSNIKAAASPEVSASPAIQAVIAQSEFGELQLVGPSYWEPVGTFGSDLAEGAIKKDDLQTTMDKLVAEITAGKGM